MERTVPIQFRVTPSEKDELQRRADQMHLSVSSYIRLKSLANDDNINHHNSEPK